MLKLSSKFFKLPSSEIFLTVLTVINIFLLVGMIVAESYYNLVTVGTGFDGWCDKTVQGVGVHCFSDYTLTALIVGEENPWKSSYIDNMNYPAASLLITFFFVKLGNLFGSAQLGLVTYLGTMVICTIIPSIWAVKGKPLFLKLLVGSATGLLTVPSIMALDRGNSIGFVVPALLMYLVGIDRKNVSLTIFGIVLATVIKPQFILLLFIPLIQKNWKVSTRSFVYASIIQLISFLFWPKDFPRSLIDATQNLFAYASSADLTRTFPTNVSLVSGIYEILTILRLDELAKVIQDFQSEISAIALITIFLLVAITSRKIPIILQTIIVIWVASVFVPVTWSYYMVFALPVAAVLLRDPLIQKINSNNFIGIGERDYFSSRATKFGLYALLIAETLSLSKIIIPNVASSPDPYPLNSGELTSFMWLLATVAILAGSTRSYDSRSMD